MKPSDIALSTAVDKAIKNLVEQGEETIVCLRVSNGEVVINGEVSSVRAVMAKDYYTDLKNSVLMSQEKGTYYKVDILPKLKAPLDLEEEEKYWTDKSVKEQVKIYFYILKWKKSLGKPVWWPLTLSFDKYEHWSYAKMRTNKKILKAILEHYGYDPEVHCEDPPSPKPKVKKSKKKVQPEKNSGNLQKENDFNNSMDDNQIRVDETLDKTDKVKNKGLLRSSKRKRETEALSTSSFSQSSSSQNSVGRRLPNYTSWQETPAPTTSPAASQPPSPATSTPPATPPRAAPHRSPSPFITPPSPATSPAPGPPCSPSSSHSSPVPASSRARSCTSSEAEEDPIVRRSTRRKWQCTANCGKNFGTMIQMMKHLSECKK